MGNLSAHLTQVIQLGLGSEGVDRQRVENVLKFDAKNHIRT